MELTMVLLIILSVIAAIGGLFSLSNATLGVGGVAFACWFAILARIAQAGRDRKLATKNAATRASSEAA